MINVSDTHQHLNPENPENPQNPDWQLVGVKHV
jgi:hypothetical protein